jgi:phenylalanine-4-hydroxylase
LKKTGIEIDNIQSMYGMNRTTEIGWAAVAVDGFIPPNAFMEFQAYNVLVLHQTFRQLEHIEYLTPDIIHEDRRQLLLILSTQNIYAVLEK